MHGTTTLGRPKKQVSGKPPEIERLAVQGTVEWCDWLRRGAEHCRTDVSKLIDAAVVNYLRAQGFPDPPPKRTP